MSPMALGKFCRKWMLASAVLFSVLIAAPCRAQSNTTIPSSFFAVHP